MFDDEFAPRKKPETLKNLEDMGIAELEDYIAHLKSEITRTQAEIEKKKAIRDRAASVFKT
jgi:uncharacterized small protein (DUF1192 family)